MIEALEDPQNRKMACSDVFLMKVTKLLYQLKNRQDDPAFDVKLQVQMLLKELKWRMF